MTEQTTAKVITDSENKDVTADVSTAVDINTSLTDSKQEKVFTQSQVDALINERIKRERKVNESLLPVKELLKAAMSKGLVKGRSYAEMAQDFVDRLKAAEEAKDGNITQDKSTRQQTDVVSEGENSHLDGGVLQVSDTCGENNSSCLGAEGQDEEIGEKSRRDTADKDGIRNEIKGDGTITVKDICALKEKYPHADMNRLFDNRMFESFAKGRSGSVPEIYDDFCAFLGLLQVSDSAKTDVAEKEHYDTRQSTGEKAVYSTAISSQSGVYDDYSDSLTKQQMDIAKSAGMSYREYAHLLSSIPKGKTRN